MICVLESRSNPSYEQFLSFQAEQQQQQLGLPDASVRWFPPASSFCNSCVQKLKATKGHQVAARGSKQ